MGKPGPKTDAKAETDVAGDGGGKSETQSLLGSQQSQV